MANVYDDAAIERIRAVLIAYMEEHRMGTPTVERLTHVPRRTVHRLVTGENVNDGALQLIERFLDRLPNHPTAMHALGDALHTVYRKTPDNLAGTYTVSSVPFADSHLRVSPNAVVLSELTISTPTVANAEELKFLLVNEVAASDYGRIYDGVLVFARSSVLVILKDRLMDTARIHTLHLDTLNPRFYGTLYDAGPLEQEDGIGQQYQMWETSVARIDHA